MSPPTPGGREAFHLPSLPDLTDLSSIVGWLDGLTAEVLAGLLCQFGLEPASHPDQARMVLLLHYRAARARNALKRPHPGGSSSTKSTLEVPVPTVCIVPQPAFPTSDLTLYPVITPSTLPPTLPDANARKSVFPVPAPRRFPIPQPRDRYPREPIRDVLPVNEAPRPTVAPRMPPVSEDANGPLPHPQKNFPAPLMPSSPRELITARKVAPENFSPSEPGSVPPRSSTTAEELRDPPYLDWWRHRESQAKRDPRPRALTPRGTVSREEQFLRDQDKFWKLPSLTECQTWWYQPRRGDWPDGTVLVSASQHLPQEKPSGTPLTPDLSSFRAPASSGARYPPAVSTAGAAEHGRKAGCWKWLPPVPPDYPSPPPVRYDPPDGTPGVPTSEGRSSRPPPGNATEYPRDGSPRGARKRVPFHRKTPRLKDLSPANSEPVQPHPDDVDGRVRPPENFR